MITKNIWVQNKLGLTFKVNMPIPIQINIPKDILQILVTNLVLE